MRPGEIVYRPPGGGLPIELTTATPELLATRLTDMDLAVLAACLRVISSRVVTAGIGPAPELNDTSAAPVTTDTMILGARRGSVVMDDGDPFR